ncbi:MAG: DNA-binding transcriptional LysR family regulator [Oceanospirillaceae bacterium]|jgi:DNA-binding transcriptional LysR family regulator
MDLTLSEIRSFHALVKQGSFTKAAKQLNVSQPAITAQIRKLESRVEQPLLERFHKGVKPTPIGLQLYRISCEYVDLDAEVEALFRPKEPILDFQLRVATSSPIIFMPLMAAFKNNYPNAKLKVISGTTETCRAAVLNREADIGLFPVTENEKGVESSLYHRHYLVAILNKNHPLSNEEVISIEQLANEPIIAHKPDSFTQKYANQLFAAQDITPHVEMEMGMADHVCNAVILNLGVGFSLSNDIHPDPRLKLIPIKEALQAVEEHLVWLKGQRKKQGIQEFVKLAIKSRAAKSILAQGD